MSSVEQLLDCAVSAWYPRFQRVAFKTVIVPLPQPVVDWLVSDGLHLPDDSQAVRATCAAVWHRRQEPLPRSGGTCAATRPPPSPPPPTSLFFPADCEAGATGRVCHRGRLPGVVERG